MKKLFFCLSLFLFVACSSNDIYLDSKKMTVAVMLAPYANIVTSIGGAFINVVTLVPVGADPHTFEPKPETLKKFSGARLYLSDGSGLDKNWMPRFSGVNSHVIVKTLGNGIAWNIEEDNELDPHLWTSPKMVKIVAHNMLLALCNADSLHCKTYEENFKKFDTHLDSLDAYVKSVIHNLPDARKKFMVFHPSYGYLARDYGLMQLAVELEGKEPKPMDLQKLITLAKKENIRTVFTMPQFSKRAAESIAHEIDGRVLSVNPLDFDFENSLRQFLEALKE